MDIEEKVAAYIVIVFLTIVCAVGIGWCLNIYKLTQLDFEAPYKAEIIRGLSIPTGIGGIVGWIDIKDK